MATRLYSFNPGNSLETITEGVGAPNSSAVIELSINIATTTTTDGSSTRAIRKEEVLQALLIFAAQIVRDTSGRLS